MPLNTTPAEATAIYALAAATARTIAREVISGNSSERFTDSLRAALALVEAGVSAPALEVGRDLARLSRSANSGASDFYRLSREVEADILGYALEAQDSETRALFVEVAG